MTERVVTFGQGPHGMNHHHQRHVVDLLVAYLGLEIVHIKEDVYKIRKIEEAPPNPRYDPKIKKGPIAPKKKAKKKSR